MSRGTIARGRCTLAVIGALTVAVGTAAHAAAPSYAPVLDCPLDPCAIVRLFDRPPAPWAAGHRGIDVAASPGDPVYSPAPGVVVVAEWVVDRHVMTIAHGSGLRSSVEPVASVVDVGTWVDTGDLVGVVEGVTHGSDAQVHWGLRDASGYLNPLDFLRGFGPIRLLPVA